MVVFSIRTDRKIYASGGKKNTNQRRGPNQWNRTQVETNRNGSRDISGEEGGIVALERPFPNL
jgi:hypothetical protein